MRLQYELEGTSNFCAWKDMMEVVLDENGVWEYTQIDILKPTASNAQEISQWKKDTTKFSWGLFWRVSQIMSFQTCMVRRLLFQCGKHSKIYSKGIVMSGN